MDEKDTESVEALTKIHNASVEDIAETSVSSVTQPLHRLEKEQKELKWLFRWSEMKWHLNAVNLPRNTAHLHHAA